MNLRSTLFLFASLPFGRAHPRLIRASDSLSVIPPRYIAKSRPRPPDGYFVFSLDVPREYAREGLRRKYTWVKQPQTQAGGGRGRALERCSRHSCNPPKDVLDGAGGRLRGRRTGWCTLHQASSLAHCASHMPLPSVGDRHRSLVLPTPQFVGC